METITYTIIRVEHATIKVPANIEPKYRMQNAINQYRKSHYKFTERYVRCIEGNDHIDFEKILDENINWGKAR